MPAPEFTLPTTGTSPKIATRLGLEAGINAVSQALFDQIGAISTGLKPAGNWDASGGSFPSEAERGTYYVVSAAGTVDGAAFAIGDWLIPLIDSPLVGTYEGNWFRGDYSKVVPARPDSAAAFEAGSDVSRGAGALWETKDGFRYEEVTTGEDLVNAVGVKLAAVKDSGGRIFASQIGIGTSDDKAKFRKLVGCLNGRCKHIVIDRDVAMPGVNSDAEFLAGEIPDGSIIEFTDGAALVYDTDGSTAHAYFEPVGVDKLTIIRPYVRSTTTPTTRTARPAIAPVLCANLNILYPKVRSVAGGGVLAKACENSLVLYSDVDGCLADGHHIRNGDATHTGTSKNVWFIGSKARNTGDDGHAVVSYDNGQPQVEDCGHLDFISYDSGARGGTLIGGLRCKLRGEVHGSNGQGVLVALDATFSTFAPVNCQVDVRTFSCVSGLSGVGAVEIGRDAKGTTGHLRSYDSLQRGVTLNGTSGTVVGGELTVYAERSAGEDLYFEGAEDVQIPSASSKEAGTNAMIVKDCTDVTIGNVNLLDYAAGGVGAYRGISFSGASSGITVGGGVIKDRMGNSERPVLVQGACSDVTVGGIKYGGGTAGNKLEVQAGATNITLPKLRVSTTYDPPSIAAGGTTTTTLTVAGARPGDAVLSVQHTANGAGNLILTGQINANDTVRVTLFNPTGGAVDLASGTLSAVTQRVNR
ncbi:MAG: hypothetical protein ABJP44_00575 [Sulfitobacter sp.]|uniref:hypothetical protein n=1 Tax=Sulfitobacter sp. TaxID=1903071 RepID=UPI003299166E